MDRRDPSGVTGRTPIALSIAGSDSGGGAGVQADLKTFAALGVYGATAITAVTAQNTLGVRAIHAVPAEVVRAQIDAVLEDFDVAAIKIGMLANADVADAVAEALGPPRPLPKGYATRTSLQAREPTLTGSRASSSPLAGEDRGGGSRRALKVMRSSVPRIKGRRDPPPCPAPTRGAGTRIAAQAAPAREEKCKRLSPDGDQASPFVVYDPVLAASSGDALASAGLIAAIKAKLLPKVDCLTPNLPEAAALIGEAAAVSEPEMIRQGRALLALGPRAVLMKGGHLDGAEAVDLLVTAERVFRFAAPKIDSPNTHGTGCTLSSAIAAQVALGPTLPDAVAAAKAFVRAAIERGAEARLGAGSGPLIQSALTAPGVRGGRDCRQ